MAMFTEMESVLKSCLETGDAVSEGLQRLAKMACGNYCPIEITSEFYFIFLINLIADMSKVKCDSADSLEAINIVKNCLNEGIPDMKNVKNHGDLHQCKEEAEQTLIKAMQESKVDGFDTCIKPKEEFLDKNNPSHCTGIE